MPRSSFIVGNIIIIESLPDNEVQTGTHLANYIHGLSLQKGPGLQLCRVSSSDELIEYLLEIERAANAGEIPMIHFEMHGTFDGRGLVTANLDVVLWADISSILFRINAATRFNLVVFVAACNGGYFLEEMRITTPTPCYALVAPTDEVNPGEVMGATRDFYRILLTTGDATKAVSSIVAQPVQQGRWFAQWAENWYWTVVLKYVRSNCTPRALKRRSMEIYAEVSAEGVKSDIGEIKKRLKASTRADLCGKYFDRFFCVDLIPENVRRFEYLRNSISSEIDLFLRNPQASARFYYSE